MPAYFDTGFSVRKPMWHGQGDILADYPDNWDDARIKAGLTWEPKVVPSYLIVEAANLAGRPIIATLPFTGQLVVEDPEGRKVVRDDTEAVIGSGVGKGWTPVLNAEIGNIVEALQTVDSNVKFETAGSCREGANVWALAYLDEPVKIAGDDSMTLPFLAVTNAHDGSGAFTIQYTDIRVVCWNTYNAAQMQGQRTGRQFTFRHTGKVMDRINEAKSALAGLRTESDEWRAMAEELATLNADDVAVQLFVQDFIPEPAADIVSDRVRGNIDRARAQFKSLYLDSVTTEGHRGTALGLVDAAVEYLDHVRGFRNQDTYLGRTILRPEPLKARAVKLARVACAR